MCRYMVVPEGVSLRKGGPMKGRSSKGIRLQTGERPILPGENNAAQLRRPPITTIGAPVRAYPAWGDITTPEMEAAYPGSILRQGYSDTLVNGEYMIRVRQEGDRPNEWGDRVRKSSVTRYNRDCQKRQR